MSWFKVPLTVTLEVADAPEGALVGGLALDTLAQAQRELPGWLNEVDLVGRDAEGKSFQVRASLTLEAESEAAAVAAVAAACAAASESWPGRPLFALGEAEEMADPRVLNESMRRLVQLASESLLEGVDRDIALLAAEGPRAFEDTEFLSALLPEAYGEHYTPLDLAQFRTALQAVGPKLEAAPDSRLASGAEELAAHGLLNHAHQLLNDYEDGDARLRAELGPGVERQPALIALADVYELALGDWDRGVAFELDSDDFDREGELTDEARTALSLAVQDWFKPFGGSGPGEDWLADHGPALGD